MSNYWEQKWESDSCNSLPKRWQPKQAMDIIDRENDYFLVKFVDKDDLSRVFDGGPWLIADHYLVVQR